MKIQPIDSVTLDEAISYESVNVKPSVTKWRLRRWFLECQFPSVLRSSSEKMNIAVATAAEENHQLSRNVYGDFGPSSVCLANMVQNFIEESSNNEKHSAPGAAAPKCSRNRCICFSRLCNNNDIFSGDDFDENSSYAASREACELLKSLVSRVSMYERNLLADTAKIPEKNQICKRKDGACRKIVTDGLSALGYDVSICNSRWDKSPSCPAGGEYEYIDVIVEGDRLLIDIDFRSEFEIARSTKAYRTIIQTLPYIFVGKGGRLQKIIAVVTDCARLSLKKKGMHFPPWRQADYVKAKWLSPYTRAASAPPAAEAHPETIVLPPLTFTALLPPLGKGSAFIAGEEKSNAVKEWKLPELKPKPKKMVNNGVKIVAGINRNETPRRILADEEELRRNSCALERR